MRYGKDAKLSLMFSMKIKRMISSLWWRFFLEIPLNIPIKGIKRIDFKTLINIMQNK